MSRSQSIAWGAPLPVWLYPQGQSDLVANTFTLMRYSCITAVKFNSLYGNTSPYKPISQTFFNNHVLYCEPHTVGYET